MPNYPSVNASTLSAVVSAAGANSQVQAWVAQAVARATRRSQFAPMLGSTGNGSKAILNVLAAQKLRGQTVHLEVDAPLGGPGQQGSSATRTGNGEERKFTTFDFTVDILWKGKKWNNAASYLSLLGSAGANSHRDQLAEWHARYQGDCIEATLIANAHAQNTIYANRKGSRELLRSADTWTPNDVSRAKEALLGLGAMPINMAKVKGDTQHRYWAQLNNRIVQDNWERGDWQTLLSQSRERGATNGLYTGELPDWMGNILNVFEVFNDASDGPQGAFCAPVAYLGEAIAALPATGATMKGGRTAAAAAKTDPKYFQYFPAAAFTGYHGTIIAAETGTEYYCLVKHVSGADAGKFSMFAYQVNDGNRLTLTKRLLSTNATSGKIDATTVGNVTFGSGDWAGYISEAAVPVGSIVVPCNSYGQPFCRGYVMGAEALACGYGQGSKGLAMGGLTTSEDQNHGLESEVGLELCWGVAPVKDANSVVNGYAIVEAAYNLDGMPTLT